MFPDSSDSHGSPVRHDRKFGWRHLAGLVYRAMGFGPRPTVDAQAGANREAFIADLADITRDAERGHRAFVDSSGRYLGFVQLVRGSHYQIVIHRIWTLHTGKGDGSHIMRTLCELADRHAVHLALKVLPIGRKPYPLQREHLQGWYMRFGFAGTRHKMVRKPATVKTTAGLATDAR